MVALTSGLQRRRPPRTSLPPLGCLPWLLRLQAPLTVVWRYWKAPHKRDPGERRGRLHSGMIWWTTLLLLSALMLPPPPCLRTS